MKDLKCPYCGHEFDYDDTDVEQDEKLEVECPCCEKIFVCIACWTLDFIDIGKADCLNGSPHKMQPAQVYPNYYPDRKRCVDCGHTVNGRFVEKPE